MPVWRAFRWTLGVSLLLLAAPKAAGAVFTKETVGDILTMRGMVPAVLICLIGPFLLRYVPAGREAGQADPPAPSSTRSGWVILFGYIAMIYATVPFGFEVVTWIVTRIGIRAFRFSLNGLGVMAGLLFLWNVLVRRRLRSWSISVRLGATGAAYAYFFAALEVPVKRIHFLEFSFLSALVFRVLRPFTGPPAIYAWIILAAMLCGAGDEAIAFFFPRRFAAISDLIWDTTAGTLGALILKFILLKR